MTEALDLETRRAVVREIAVLTRDKYVYVAVGAAAAAQLENWLEEGRYDAIGDPNELALALTSDLRQFSNDTHWAVVYDPAGAAEHVDPEKEADEARLARYLRMARRTNFGFERVERLRGNVGYIDLRRFEPSEHAGETAVAAMNFVANCDALIFDLRQNHGGYPSMVQLITSYLVDAEPRHINTFYYRPTDSIQQFWTLPHVPGRRRPAIPVYVLTSAATGSGAEEFAYNLKAMERATLVGETTVGAAHPVTKEPVGYGFDVRLPYGRPINPITQGNWEGTGVEPHISVPQAEALQVAHLHALDHLAAVATDPGDRSYLDWVTEIVASDYAPVSPDAALLSRMAGAYGERTFSVQEGRLFYRHRAFPASWVLVPMTATRFRLDEDMKFEFVLEGEGAASAVLISYRDGRSLRAERGGETAS
jgi:hypothetical protein